MIIVTINIGTLRLLLDLLLIFQVEDPEFIGLFLLREAIKLAVTGRYMRNAFVVQHFRLSCWNFRDELMSMTPLLNSGGVFREEMALLKSPPSLMVAYFKVVVLGLFELILESLNVVFLRQILVVRIRVFDS